MRYPSLRRAEALPAMLAYLDGNSDSRDAYRAIWGRSLWGRRAWEAAEFSEKTEWIDGR